MPKWGERDFKRSDLDLGGWSRWMVERGSQTGNAFLTGSHHEWVHLHQFVYGNQCRKKSDSEVCQWSGLWYLKLNCLEVCTNGNAPIDLFSCLFMGWDGFPFWYPNSERGWRANCLLSLSLLGIVTSCATIFPSTVQHIITIMLIDKFLLISSW